MFDAANAALDSIIAVTARNLNRHRAAGGTDDQFKASLVGEFMAQAAISPPGAGAIHMALAVCRLAEQSQQLWWMYESIQMRDALISVLTEWEEQ